MASRAGAAGTSDEPDKRKNPPYHHPSGQPPSSLRQPNGKHPFSGCFPLFFTVRPVSTAEGGKQEAGGRRREAGGRRQEAPHDNKHRTRKPSCRPQRPSAPATGGSLAAKPTPRPCTAPPTGRLRTQRNRPQKARENPPGKAERSAAQKSRGCLWHPRLTGRLSPSRYLRLARC